MKIKNQKARMQENKRNNTHCINSNYSSINDFGNSKY